MELNATVRTIVDRFGGKPVRIRPERDETQPQHADMLRYDQAFCNPAKVSEVIFPVFKGKNGRSSNQITIGRWDSFSLKVGDGESRVQSYDDWYTFTYVPPDYHTLVKETLAEYIARRKREGEKLTIAGWR